MAEALKIDGLQFPPKWVYLETHRTLSFVTRVKYRVPDDSDYIWNPRRHRKHFGPIRLLANGRPQEYHKQPSFFVWQPNSLNWWIAVLFMIGSSGFIIGSILFLAGYSQYLVVNLTFFIGSIFFTSAAYCQYHQAINAGTSIDYRANKGHHLAFGWQPWNISFWVTVTQFIGTIMFNFNTFDAFLKLGTLGQDLMIWVPDMVGSILFQLSGTLALLEMCHGWWCVRTRDFSWWVTIFGFFGCVAFLISAFMAFQRLHPVFPHLAAWATFFTLVGAICFFVAAYLMWPEMTSEANTPN